MPAADDEVVESAVAPVEVNAPDAVVVLCESSEVQAVPITMIASPALPMSLRSMRLVRRVKAVMNKGYDTSSFARDA